MLTTQETGDMTLIHAAHVRHEFFKTVWFYFRVVWPIFSVLLFAIVLFGVIISYEEGWNPFEGIYFAFVTGLTIGYGDLVQNGIVASVGDHSWLQRCADDRHLCGDQCAGDRSGSADTGAEGTEQRSQPKQTVGAGLPAKAAARSTSRLKVAATRCKHAPTALNRYPADFAPACFGMDTEVRSRVSTFTASSTTALLIAVR